jgi:hypothetical protein
MKRFVTLFVIFLLLSPALLSQIVVIDDFEDGTPGRFNLHTTFSGSTTGILSTIPTVDSTTAALGTKSLRIVLVDDPASTNDWFVRLLSGGGNPGSNLLLNDTGWVGYWIKTNKSYLSCGFIMDDLNASGTGVGTNERSVPLQIIGDNQWHVYQWQMEDSLLWNAFIASGNGKIEDPVTIDAIYFTAPNALADGDTAIVYLDHVSFNPTGFVPVELVSFSAAVNLNQVDLRWITSTEKNNMGFEVQRNSGAGSFETIGFVSGKGTSTEISAYTFTDIVQTAGNYQYRLKQVDYDGKFEFSNTIEVDILALPNEYALAQNYPNPFNPSTTITYNIAEAGLVNLSVYNLLGEKVAELVNTIQQSGLHQVEFNGSKLASGTYIYTLNVNGNSVTKKMMLMK